MLKTFEVKIVRHLDGRHLETPEEEWVAEGGSGGPVGAGGSPHNLDYEDLRGCDWSDTKHVFNYESERIAETILLDEEEAEELVEQEYEEDILQMSGLDLGVASTVFALSAARCIPSTSCNGGSFGEDHREHYPLVLFYAYPEHVPLLLEAAEEAEVGLEHDNCSVQVYANDVRHMMKFAQALISRSNRFDALTL